MHKAEYFAGLPITLLDGGCGGAPGGVARRCPARRERQGGVPGGAARAQSETSHSCPFGIAILIERRYYHWLACLGPMALACDAAAVDATAVAVEVQSGKYYAVQYEAVERFIKVSKYPRRQALRSLSESGGGSQAELHKSAKAVGEKFGLQGGRQSLRIFRVRISTQGERQQLQV